jgi:hypothetical protein
MTCITKLLKEDDLVNCEQVKIGYYSKFGMTEVPANEK